MTVLARPIRYREGIEVPKDARFDYMSSGGTHVIVPFPLDPETQLQVKAADGDQAVKNRFGKLIRGQHDRQERVLLCVAYHMLRGSDRRYESALLSPCDALDCAITGHTEGLRTILETDPGARDRPDSVGLPPLYLACRGGFYDTVLFLLQQGADPKVVCGSERKTTCLHVAAFYKHHAVCHLLLYYGADIHARNDYGGQKGSTPLDEAKGDQLLLWKLTSSAQDLIAKLFKEWSDLDLLHDTIPLMERRWKDEVIAHVFPRKGAVHQVGWHDSFHGTRLMNKYGGVVSILKHGLKRSGSEVDGVMIEPKDNHWQLGVEHDGIKNFPAAIFVSPSVLYATHACYSDRLSSEDEDWCLVLHVQTKPETFTRHTMTVDDKPALRPGEPANLEWRIETEKDLIWRCKESAEPDEKKLQVQSVMFIKLPFLKGIGNKDKGLPNYKDATKLIIGAA